MNEIDVNSLTDFTWDKALFFPPYTTQKSITEHLRIRYKDPSDMDMRDDIYLIVYLQDNKVVQYAEINCQQSDFNMGGQKYLTPSDSSIKIELYYMFE